MMAGDLQMTHASMTKFKVDSKIWEIPAKSANDVFQCKRLFVGLAGNADNFSSVLEWLWSPTDKRPKVKGVEMLLLNDKGHIFHATTLYNWLRLKEKHFAIGSGMQYAIAAMDAGKTPYEAVKIASNHDVYTGMGYNKLEMK